MKTNESGPQQNANNTLIRCLYSSNPSFLFLKQSSDFARIYVTSAEIYCVACLDTCCFRH
jgi:hypothetical protein